MLIYHAFLIKVFSVHFSRKEKMISPSYSSAILTPPPNPCLLCLLRWRQVLYHQCYLEALCICGHQQFILKLICTEPSIIPQNSFLSISTSLCLQWFLHVGKLISTICLYSPVFSSFAVAIRLATSILSWIQEVSLVLC